MMKFKGVPRKSYLAVAGLCLAGVIAMCYYYFFTSVFSGGETEYLYVDADDTADSVCVKLQPVVNSHALTAMGTLLRHVDADKAVRAGRYAVQQSDCAVTLFRKLKNGQQTPLMLTIPESRTMEKLAGVLGRRLMLDSTELVTALKSNEVLSAWNYDTCTVPCLFVPNTYEVYWNVSAEQLLSRMSKEHDAFWNYDRLHKAEALGLTANEVCTLASIIDEETANNAEKPMIAGMYLNRLAKGMPLQADPTVKFALKRFELRRIYRDMLRTESAYNTYVNTGLPPGPIKIASIKGIDAVLNRVSHNYLYMCAKEDFSGTHRFAATYQEHLKNAARYAKALNERGVK